MTTLLIMFFSHQSNTCEHWFIDILFYFVMLNKSKLRLLKLFYTLIIKHHGLNAGSLATLFYHSCSLETLDEDNGECISAAAEGSLAKAEKRGLARHMVQNGRWTVSQRMLPCFQLNVIYV